MPDSSTRRENCFEQGSKDPELHHHRDGQEESRHFNTAQKQILLEFFETHPYLMKKKCNDTDTFSKDDGVVLWTELAQKLNAVVETTSKSWETWEGIWSELYSKLVLQDATSLTEIDQLLLDLITKTNSEGIDKASMYNEAAYEGPRSEAEACQMEIGPVDSTSENYGSSLKETNLLQNRLSVSTASNSVQEPSKSFKIDPSKIIIVRSTNLNNEAAPQNDNNLQTGSTAPTIRIKQSTDVLEKTLIKKLIKSDLIKIRYLKQKLKMEGEYHKRKLSLMKDMLMIKQRKVRVEEKQAAALVRIARSLDRMVQNRQHLEHH